MSCVRQALSTVTGTRPALHACSCCYYLMTALGGAVAAVLSPRLGGPPDFLLLLHPVPGAEEPALFSLD